MSPAVLWHHLRTGHSRELPCEPLSAGMGWGPTVLWQRGLGVRDGEEKPKAVNPLLLRDDRRFYRGSPRLLQPTKCTKYTELF